LKALACHLAEECERQWRAYQVHIEGRTDEPEPYAARLKDRRSRAVYRDLEECRGYDDLVRRFR
jgi:hypothetical protein